MFVLCASMYVRVLIDVRHVRVCFSCMNVCVRRIERLAMPLATNLPGPTCHVPSLAFVAARPGAPRMCLCCLRVRTPIFCLQSRASLASCGAVWCQWTLARHGTGWCV